MKNLSFKRVISICLALVAMISCVSVLAFADCKASDAQKGSVIWVATSESIPLFGGKPTVTIENPSSTKLLIKATIVKDSLGKGRTQNSFFNPNPIFRAKEIPANGSKEIELLKGVDVKFECNDRTPNVKFTVTPGKYIWNIWGGTVVKK